MLVKFSVKNFRGFKDKITWDLSNAKEYTFNPDVIDKDKKIKNGIIKNGIIYGPNGCGKTSFSLAIFDIVNHLTQKWKKSDYYRNFANVGHENDLVEFEYVFRFNNQILDYKYSKNINGYILSEELQVDKNMVFKKDVGGFNSNTEFPMDQNIITNLLNSINNVSVVNYIMTSYPLSKEHYLLNLQQFVNSMLWFRCLEGREFIGLEVSPRLLDEYIIKNELFDDFSLFLEETSQQKFSFCKRENDDKELFCLIDNNIIQFSNIASTGTEALKLLYFWIKKMENASFVFIDEFDAFYHFDLAFKICQRLFALKCQVFLSSHNTYLMTNDLLRPDCNFIINHNKIKPLCDCTNKELRFGHNIEKLFRGGTFKI